jgi:hypothetical protein
LRLLDFKLNKSTVSITCSGGTNISVEGNKVGYHTSKSKTHWFYGSRLKDHDQWKYSRGQPEDAASCMPVSEEWACIAKDVDPDLRL